MKAGNDCLSHIPTLQFSFLFLIVHPKLTKPHKIAITILLENEPKIWNVSQGEIGDSLIQTCEGLKLKGGEAWCATTRKMDSKHVPKNMTTDGNYLVLGGKIVSCWTTLGSNTLAVSNATQPHTCRRHNAERASWPTVNLDFLLLLCPYPLDSLGPYKLLPLIVIFVVIVGRTIKSDSLTLAKRVKSVGGGVKIITCIVGMGLRPKCNIALIGGHADSL
jgi:hypothetical protein